MIDFKKELLNLICSSLKLERDKGLSELQRHLNSTDIHELNEFKIALISLFEKEIDLSWEKKLGALLASKILIPHIKRVNDNKFYQLLITISQKLLTDNEVRVRLAAGEVLGCLCENYGIEVFQTCHNYVYQLIEENLEREVVDAGALSFEELKEIDNLRKKLETAGRDKMSPAGEMSPRRTREEIFHDTAGWKCLETSMKCLQAMVEGCGRDFAPWVNQSLLDLIFTALNHTNRFVRETGFYVLGSLVSCGLDASGNITEDSPFQVNQFGHQVCHALAKGLGDNWSQVRLASSEATRKFLLSFPTDEQREPFFPILLPRMCLNRYYVADGVRIYSQESWRRVARTQGRELVQRYIQHFVDYYISQTKANNHAVREAACACIAELAAKISKTAVSPYVPQLLQTLLECFEDDSWPVRDAACLASGNFVLCYPEEARAIMDRLYPFFFENLQDPIPSVRQGAAAALGNVVRAYGEESVNIIRPHLEKGLRNIVYQKPQSQKYAGLSQSPATYSVVKRVRDNDPDLHTNQTMYSCGSLAPKMGRGGGGCSSGHSFRRPSEPWETADGCVHLVAELAQLCTSMPHVATLVTDCLPLLAEAGTHRSYEHHVIFLESLCKQLPNIAKGMGKRHFKKELELFIDTIFYSLNCENSLTSSAASQCLCQLASILGEAILRGRVELHNPSYLPQLQSSLSSQAF